MILTADAEMIISPETFGILISPVASLYTLFVTTVLFMTTETSAIAYPKNAEMVVEKEELLLTATILFVEEVFVRL